MASSKPKKGFSMSLGKMKLSSSAKNRPEGADRSTTSKPSAIRPGRHEEEEEEDRVSSKRDYVTGIGGGKVDTKEKIVERGPRVIPLAENPWQRDAAARTAPVADSDDPAAASAGQSSEGSTSTPAPLLTLINTGSPAATAAAPANAQEGEKSLDQLAVEAIARESRAGGVEAASRNGLGLDSDRVIRMAATPGAGLGSESAGAATGQGGKRTGLLAENMIPGLAEVDGEDAKFKHDLDHRAEDMNVRSRAYVDVPVSEFGAALLRGMGWTGEEGNGGGAGGGGDSGLPNDVEPRHHRLGLGAQPKPPEEMKKPRKRKPGEKPRTSDAERLKIWEQKAKEEREQASRPRASKLSVMDVVELSEGSDGSRSGGGGGRAMVLQTEGVPGLNKISVRMERTGEKILVDKKSVTRVSQDDLARRPFSDKKAQKYDPPDGQRDSTRSSNGYGDGGKDVGARRGVSKRSRSRSTSRSRSRSVEKRGRGGDKDRRDEKKSKRPKTEKKKRKKSASSGIGGGGGEGGSLNGYVNNAQSSDRDRRVSRPRSPPSSGEDDRNPDRRRRQSSPTERGRDRRRDDRGRGDASPDRKRPRDNGNGNGYSNGGGREATGVRWLRANIRVRVVSKSYAGGRAYLGKGRVVDVPRVGEATVRMDLGELVLEGVKQRHLETVLPARGGKVVVVRGAERGTTGKLLAKDNEKETALVQVYEDLRAIRLSLDDVAEFTGMLDQDMEDVGY